MGAQKRKIKMSNFKNVSNEFIVINPGTNRALAGSGIGIWAKRLKVWIIPTENWKKAEALLKAGETAAEKSGEPVKVQKADMKPAPISKKTTAKQAGMPTIEERITRMEEMLIKFTSK